MKLRIDQPVIDITQPHGEDGKPVQAKFNSQPASLRTIITFVCTTQGMTVDPQTKARTPETPAEAAEAYALGVRAYMTPVGGDLDLKVTDASLLKTRAYLILPPLYAGALDLALEQAAESASPPAAEPDAAA